VSGHTPFRTLPRKASTVISEEARQTWERAYRHGLSPIAQTMAGIDIFDPVPSPAPEHMELLRDALQLVQELWPHPYSASVTLETHQWVKLRKVLLGIPDLLAEAER
jgi:hypothetical protein